LPRFFFLSFNLSSLFIFSSLVCFHPVRIFWFSSSCCCQQ
jgi:hypothetical protein